jgi:hypothetical protein
MSVPQPELAAHLRDPARPAPLLAPALPSDIATPAQRIAVHANNRRAALCDALRANHPVVAQLVGDEFFQAMAREFVASHPPRTPALLHYGEALPRFIESFEPADAVPYLADVARIERAWRESYHAADPDPLSLGALAGADPAVLLASRVELHPSARLVESRWPVASLWRAHQRAHEGRGLRHDGAECVLVVRPAARVRMHRVSQADATMLRRLAEGATLEASALERPERLGRLLARLLTWGAIVRFHPGEEST